MTNYARIADGVVAEMIALPDGAKLTAIFSAAVAATLVSAPTDQAVAVGMSYANGAFGPPPAPPLAQLKTALSAAASGACASVVAQIYPDATHQSAFQNAASMVNGNGGAAPTIAPLAAKFAALAAVYGLPASAFATLGVAMQGADLDLSAALATLDDAVDAATTPAALAAALTAFETAIAATVAEINAAAPPTAIVAPAAIRIVGVNA